ncbi:MAG TPA: hypothetical protein VF044_05250, partial [Actinomycetota bacterium]
MNRHLLLAALPLVLACAFTLAPAATAAGETTCPPGVTVANVWQTVSNDGDTGVAGNAWASMDYARTIVITEVAPLTYCARANSSGGTFTTYRGTSPRATGRVKAGRTGTITHRWRSTLFTGLFLPKVPVTGYIGSVNYGCSESLGCPGFVDWRSLFFAETAGYDLTSFSWGFNGGS